MYAGKVKRKEFCYQGKPSFTIASITVKSQHRTLPEDNKVVIRILLYPCNPSAIYVHPVYVAINFIHLL